MLLCRSFEDAWNVQVQQKETHNFTPSKIQASFSIAPREDTDAPQKHPFSFFIVSLRKAQNYADLIL